MHNNGSYEILESLPIAAFILNDKGIIKLCNSVAEIMFGYPGSVLVNHPFYKLIPGHPTAVKYMESVPATPKADTIHWGLQINAIRNDGTVFPVRIKTGRYIYKDENVLLVFISDLTEEKNLSEKFSKIFYKSPAAKVLSKTDTGIIVDVNETFCRLSEYSKEELIGKSSIDLDFFSQADERQKLVAILRDEGRVTNLELATRTKNKRPVSILLSVEALEINNKNFLLSTCIDITEKKKFEENLSRQAMALRDLSEAGTRLWRINDLYEGCNEMLSYCTGLLGANKGDVQLFDRETNTLKLACSAGLSKKFINYYSTISSRSDTVCWKALSNRKQIVIADIDKETSFATVKHFAYLEGFRTVLSTPFFASNGDPLGVISICSNNQAQFDPIHLGMIDLYARKAESFIEKHRANEALKEVNQYLEMKVKERTTELTQWLEQEKGLNDLKSRFLSIASHEFRTPLTTILSSVTLLEAYSKRNQYEPQKKHFDRVRSSVNNMVYILDEFLSIEKLEQKRVTINAERFNLKEFIEDVIGEMTGMLKDGQVISTDYSGILEIVLDKRVLKNILLNFLSNAIKYSKNDSQIKVSIKAGDQVSLIIQDEGIGIPEEEQKQLFTKFFRAKNAIGIQGTGLGLNIVRRYIELLDGSISFSSTPNVGTTFIITLPNNDKVV